MFYALAVAQYIFLAGLTVSQATVNSLQRRAYLILSCGINISTKVIDR